MITQFLQRLLWLVVLVTAQMMVFNYIHILDYATPLPFVYLVLLFPLGTSRWSILLWAFVCGLLCDITSLTLGIGAASITLVAFVQPVLLRLMTPKDAPEDMQPSYSAMGFWSYVGYAAILTSIFSLCYFILQSFSFNHIIDLGIACASTWALTLVLCLIFEGLRDHSTSKLA